MTTANPSATTMPATITITIIGHTNTGMAPFTCVSRVGGGGDRTVEVVTSTTGPVCDVGRGGSTTPPVVGVSCGPTAEDVTASITGDV